MKVNIPSDKANYKVLGILIRSKRISDGYSLRDLASLTNISHTLIANIEKGKQIPALETLSEIFRVLKMNFYDDPMLISEFRELSALLYNQLFFQDYEDASKTIALLEAKEEMYLFSSEVVNYMLVKCLYYTMTNTPITQLRETLKHYEKFIDFFSDYQKQIYYFIDGLDMLNQEHYNKATNIFYKAATLGDREKDVFIKEYNVISLVRQYKFIDAYRIGQEIVKEFENRTIYIRAMKTKLQIARVFYHIKKNAEVLKITEYVKNFASKYHIDELTEECLMLEAGVAIRLKDYQKANELMEYMPDPESIPTVIFKFKIALFENDYSKLEEYYLKVLSFDSVKNNRKIWLYINVQAMNRLPKYYNKEVYLKYVLELTKMSSQNNDQDILEISYTYLIRYYQEERMYKKAMEAANELLFYKDVPFEDKVVNRIYEN